MAEEKITVEPKSYTAPKAPLRTDKAVLTPLTVRQW